MFQVKEYVKAESLEQAYVLNHKRSNVIVGGMLWLKMSNRNYHTAIDLSGLELDQIREYKDRFVIGCMTSLRQLELHQGLDDSFGGIIRESVRHIVGTQFRNVATAGGSIFGRYGFSDLLTSLLVLDTYVELYKGGKIPLAKFCFMEPDNDILVNIIIYKDARKTAYHSRRVTATDFPVLTAACSQIGGVWRAAVGGRPGRARMIEDETGILGECPEKASVSAFLDYYDKEITFGSNMRGSAAYRRHLAEVLLLRGIQDIVRDK